MNKSIRPFKDWYIDCFIPTAKAYCKRKNIDFKILLLIDNATVHNDFPDVNENVKIKFLPPNTTSLLQPLDQGAIAITKAHYK